MKAYIEDRVAVRPGGVPDFFAALEAAGPAITERGVRSLGAFATAGATGHWNEVFVYWEMDGWQHYADVMKSLPGPGSLCDLADPDWSLRTGGFSNTMAPSVHCPTLAQLLEAEVSGTVFLHEYIRPIPGKREEYIEHYVDNYLEATRKAGRELVGIWELKKSANDVLILLALRDWDAQAHAVGVRPDAYAEKPWRTSAPQVREDYDLRMLEIGPRSINPLAPTER